MRQALTRAVRVSAALLALLVATPSALAGDAWSLDPVHTRVLFTVSHAGFSNALGTISGSTGTLHFDRDHWQGARLEVTVPLTRLDLGDAGWNTAVLAGNLLDGERHPVARFVSTKVEAVDADHARACGELSLHGVTRPLCMDVTLNALKRHPLPPFRRTAGFTATATLSRAEFGIDAWKSVIGDEVQLRIEAEAVRVRSADDDDPLDDAPAPEPDPTLPASSSQPTREPEPVPEPTP
ncbi:YceI family protein [Montanilutibacter psychrotolerans]|uniref:Polyisoprenoid-binding protein n=1 Tax=Montanilutibacter psychrotolerans TaxID=1327343 RepID=A0A3M8T3A9_9GAMM|nr:YceI family protein [Lysobacter psychrotolerans]RNF86014.1 polyisoprenoid-binding protein [Lysobacter psychrotolerans]